MTPSLKKKSGTSMVWVELVNHNLLIGGVYRRARTSPELEKAEFTQLSKQIIKAASTGKKVLVLGDMNVDHTNPNHKKSKEAKDLLSDLEAINMRRIPSSIPTWKSYGVHKVCPCLDNLHTKIVSDLKKHDESVHIGKKPFKCSTCDISFPLEADLNMHISSVHKENVRAACGCLKRHHSSVIDNAYLSISEDASLQVLDDAISDHFPILVNLATKMESNTKTKTIYKRDISRLVASEFEDALEMKDWSPLYNMNDPNEATALLIKNVTEALDSIALLKAIKVRLDKPKISLKKDTLAAMASRDRARKEGHREQFKFLEILQLN